MRRAFLPAMLVVLGIVTSIPATATIVTVPDDFPTIQLALDSDADTIRIRAGHYAERPNVGSDNTSRVIEGLPANGVRPTIGGLTLSLYREVIVRACTFTRPVDLRGGAGFVRLTFDSCDFDSGLVHHIADTNDYEYVAILRSRIRGNVTLPAFFSLCEADTFEASGVAFDNQSSAQVRLCWFRGPTSTNGNAMTFNGEGSGDFRENTIEDYRRGIASGGFEAQITVEDNRIERCSVGIEVQNEQEDHVRNNLIRDCETGIAADVFSGLEVSGNVVLGSTDAGIDLRCDNGTTPSILGNITGRSGSDGIRVEFTGGPFSSWGVVLKNNTSYRNLGAGFRILASGKGPYDLYLKNNIGFENGTYGVDADSSAMPDSCNNWYGNLAGSTRGVALSGTDLAVEPLFCNVHIDSVALSAKSPLLDASGCGLIGARGQGCTTTPTLVSLFTAERDAEGVRVRWRIADPTRIAEIWIERANAQSGPWITIAAERGSEGDADVYLDRSVSSENEYWYRLVAREGNERAVIGEPLKVEAEVASRFQLVRVSPNPGSGPLRISFTLAHEATVEVDVFDVQGRHVASLVRGSLAAGAHEVEWSGLGGKRGPTSRLHFVRYRYPGGQQVLRFVRLR